MTGLALALLVATSPAPQPTLDDLAGAKGQRTELRVLRSLDGLSPDVAAAYRDVDFKTEMVVLEPGVQPGAAATRNQGVLIHAQGGLVFVPPAGPAPRCPPCAGMAQQPNPAPPEAEPLLAQAHVVSRARGRVYLAKTAQRAQPPEERGQPCKPCLMP